MGSPLSPATDIYSLGLVLLECIKGTVEYPGSAVESAVARLHRAPVLPEDLPEEWKHLLASMTAIDPLERPSAADLEIALRQALVSPESVPGDVADDHTRVLPALPPRPPSSVLSDDYATADQFSHGAARAPLESSTLSEDAVQQNSRPSQEGKPRSRRVWLASAVAAAALLASATAVTLAVTSAKTPDVVIYPTVTGTLGDHLVELQKSVEP